jgi:erythromycin esterase-like protein
VAQSLWLTDQGVLVNVSLPEEVGFTTHHGTVTAASDWEAPAERKSVRPALPGSYEALFHTTEVDRFLLTWRSGDTATETLREARF